MLPSPSKLVLSDGAADPGCGSAGAAGAASAPSRAAALRRVVTAPRWLRSGASVRGRTATLDVTGCSTAPGRATRAAAKGGRPVASLSPQSVTEQGPAVAAATAARGGLPPLSDLAAPPSRRTPRMAATQERRRRAAAALSFGRASFKRTPGVD